MCQILDHGTLGWWQLREQQNWHQQELWTVNSDRIDIQLPSRAVAPLTCKLSNRIDVHLPSLISAIPPLWLGSNLWNSCQILDWALHNQPSWESQCSEWLSSWGLQPITFWLTSISLATYKLAQGTALGSHWSNDSITLLCFLDVGMKRWHLDSHKGCLGLVTGLIHWSLVNGWGVHVPSEYAVTIHGR
jgi:hypothetical protein